MFRCHHGLRFAEKFILDYIKDKDIIDAGAFICDSALILTQYTSKKIYSYEVSSTNYKEILKTLNNNNGARDKIKASHMGLGKEKSVMYSSKDNIIYGGNHLTDRGSNPVTITTIDDEVKQNNLTIGLIKIDTEGFEYPIMLGALETIKRDRPVFTLSLYHNEEGLFGLTELIKTFGNYVIEYRSPGYNSDDFNELFLFAYPAEIGYHGKSFNDY